MFSTIKNKIIAGGAIVLAALLGLLKIQSARLEKAKNKNKVYKKLENVEEKVEKAKKKILEKEEEYIENRKSTADTDLNVLLHRKDRP